jgi:hypothetical protein
LSENLKVRDHLEDLGVDGSIILRCMLGCDDVGDLSGSVYGPVMCGKEQSGSIKCKELLD